MTVGEVCKRNVAVAAKSETIVDAAKHMRAHYVGDLVVVEDRQGRRVPIGVITDRDIVVSAVASESGHIESLLVGDVMSPDLVTAREHETTEAAPIRLLASRMLNRCEHLRQCSRAGQMRPDASRASASW